MAEPWRPALQAWLHLHLGVITVRTLVGFGCSHRNVHRLVESGAFAIISPGMLRSTHWPLGPEQLMMAACLRNENAVIAGPAAARAWKWRGLPADDCEVKAIGWQTMRITDLSGVERPEGRNRAGRSDEVEGVAGRPSRAGSWGLPW